MSTNNLENFTDFLENETEYSPPLSLPSSGDTELDPQDEANVSKLIKPLRRTGEQGGLRSVEEIEPKYRGVFNFKYFNLIQSKVIDDALYSDKSLVVCAPTGSGKTVVFEMAIVQLLMEIEDKNCVEDFKIIYMAPIKALCTERITEWYPKFTKFNLLCIEVTGDTDIDFSQLKPYRIIITTPEKWDMLTRRWRDNRGMVEMIKLFLIDEVHILNDASRGPVLEAVVSRMKTIQSSVQSTYQIELLKQNQGNAKLTENETTEPKIRFVAVSATIGNPEDVAQWLGTSKKPAIFYKFGDECRPVKVKRVVEGYPCPRGASIFQFDIFLNHKLWPIIHKYHNGKSTLIFCNSRRSVILAAEILSRKITFNYTNEQKEKLGTVASTIKNKKIQSLVLCGIGCHHAGLLYEERIIIEKAFRNCYLPILITTTTLAMGVNLPAHLVIIKNTQQYVDRVYQEYSISTVLQMMGRAGRPQFDTEATAVIMTRLEDKGRYQALAGGSEPLQSYLHKRLPENLNSEAALGTVNDVAQCVQWLRSTFLFVRAARDPKQYLGLTQSAPAHLMSKKIEDLCVKAMNALASSGLITMDEASCIESTEAGRLMSIYYLDLETMKQIMKIKGDESLEQLLWIVCESHELSDMHLRVDERRCLNALNRNNAAATIRFPMKGKIKTRQMKLNCLIQAVLGCLPIHEPSLNQEAVKIMKIADRICKCIVAYVARTNLQNERLKNYQAVLNSIILAKCFSSCLWENSVYVSRQLKGIGPTFSTLLATAGKISFTLLESSHPRDLERIMNKGPPAGNLICKQISLLPKYQLTITPIDDRNLKVQLMLINMMYLAENMGQLTAGDNHKCYIVIGDTENNLLLLTSFKDKDLIRIYDGQLSYDITRKQDFEHKIIAHCISTNFAGIDVQCEYLFQSLDPLSKTNSTKITSIKKASNKNIKQGSITDTYKARKKNICDTKTSHAEKSKRDFPVIEKNKPYDRSIEKFYNLPKIDLCEDIETSHNNEYPADRKDFIFGPIKINAVKEAEKDSDLEECISEISNLPKYEEIVIADNLEEDEQINNILKEIDNEIGESDKTVKTRNSDLNTINNKEKVHSSSVNKKNNFNKLGNKIRNKEKSNFEVINSIEKKADVINREDLTLLKPNTFTSTVKSHVDQYLEKTKEHTRNLESNFSNIIEAIEQESEIENELEKKKTDFNLISIGKNVNEAIEPERVIVNELEEKKTFKFDEFNLTSHGKNVIEATEPKRAIGYELEEKKTGNLDVFNLKSHDENIIEAIEPKRALLKEFEEKKTVNSDDFNFTPYGKFVIEAIEPKRATLNEFDEKKTVNFEDFNLKSHVKNSIEALKQKREIVNEVEDNKNLNLNHFNLTSISKKRKLEDDVTVEYHTNDKSGQEFNYYELKINNTVFHQQMDSTGLKTLTHQNNEIILSKDNHSSLIKDLNEHSLVLNDSSGSYLNSNFNTKHNLRTSLSNEINFFKKPCLSHDFINTKSKMAAPMTKPLLKLKENYLLKHFNKHHPSKEIITCNALESKASNFTENVKSFFETDTILNTSSNVTINDDHNRNYCLVSRLKIDVDIVQTVHVINKTDNIPSTNEAKEIQNNLDSLKIDSKQYEVVVDDVPLFKEIDADNSSNLNTNLDTASNFELMNDNMRSQETQNENTKGNNSECMKQDHTVKDIIYKYKDIITRNYKTSIPQGNSAASATNCGDIYVLNKKYEKPCSITDLQNLQHLNFKLSPTTYPKLEAKRCDIIRDENVKIQNFEPNKCTLGPTNTNNYKDNFNLPSPTTKSSTAKNEYLQYKEELPINNDFNLSQSMFNPKAVLEILEQDFIIPPPSQFCDTENKIPSEHDSQVFKMEPNSSNMLYNTDPDFFSENNHMSFQINRDNFQGIQNTVLTPSGEAARRTLFKDDTLYADSFKSSTFKHNKMAGKHIFRAARQLKLNKFKYSRKNVFKLQK
ncbi:probable ATP-dependent DNA helicase HFM1 [Battus philenor]|uniref:probable ATP-dependent DNA helicase HFM1 n=1 Tax=Battus philenor TaxID=42288 RepID=UPI0035CF99C9